MKNLIFPSLSTRNNRLRKSVPRRIDILNHYLNIFMMKNDKISNAVKNSNNI